MVVAALQQHALEECLMPKVENSPRVLMVPLALKQRAFVEKFLMIEVGNRFTVMMMALALQ